MIDRCYQTILLFGAPGVGKGTQGKILGAIPGFYHLSMGEAFRTLDPQSELGRTCLGYSDRGELVPNELTIRLWREYVAQKIDEGVYRPATDLLVLDGIPRNMDQAALLEDYIDVLRIVHLVAQNEEAMIERLRRRALKENRADDAREEVIRRRWEIYREDTEPVLDYYASDLVREVDAVGSPGGVLINVLQIVVQIQEAVLARQNDDSEAA